MPKIAAGIAVAGVIATGGTLTADQMINPYTTKGVMLEISASSTLPEAGTEKAIIDTTQPKVTLQKWNGEVAMGVTLQGMTATGARKFLSKEVDWQQGNQTMSITPLAASSSFEDGGYAIDITLASKPVSNVFTFQLDNWENLDFFYQGALWQEAGLIAPTKDCTNTICHIVGDGTSTRSIDLVGSYAVYFKSHVNHVQGAKNYATGKAYQIFRPQVTDASGVKVWATLSYSDGVLQVIVPQSFLDTALYPVVIDPNFGYTTIGGTKQTGDSGFNTGRMTDMGNGPSDSGAITSISLYSDTGSGNSCNFVYMIYDGANPNTRKDYTAQQNIGASQAAAWRSYANQASYTLISGTDYYIGYYVDTCGGNGILESYYDVLSAAYARDDATYSSPPPATYTRNATGSRSYSAYVTYTAAGGGGTAVKPPDIISF